MSTPPSQPSGVQALAVCAATFVLLSLPFWFTPFAPLVDLPQHLCQITLAKQVLSGEAAHLVIQWYHPNTLVYILIGAWMAFLPPIAAGHAVALTILAGWIAAVMYLAWQRGRSLAAAMVACILVFNLAWYWGFLNFLVGWPLFAVFVARLDRWNQRFRGGDLLLLSIGLLLAHTLWFLMASVVLFVHVLLLKKQRWAERIRRLAWWLPGSLYAFIWFVFFSDSLLSHGFRLGPKWHTSPWARIQPPFLAENILGGIPMGWIRFFLIGLVVWLMASAITNVRGFRGRLDRHLCMVAAVVGTCALIMPSSYMATILFATRWMAVAGIFVILALPAPQGPPLLRGAFALLLVAAMGVVTSVHWHGLYRDGLSGLTEALDQVPPAAGVIGLDYQPTSEWIQNRPYMHLFAYSQAMHGGVLNFSFTEHPSVLVVRKAPRQQPWPKRVDWFVSRLRDADFGLFDVALVHGSQRDHQAVADKPFLSALTTGGVWRAYQIHHQDVPDYSEEQPTTSPASGRTKLLSSTPPTAGDK